MNMLQRLITAAGLCLACHLSLAAEPARTESAFPATSAASSTSTLGTVANPMTVRVLPQEIPEADRAAQERERAEKSSLDARMVNYTAFLAFFTFVLAFSTIALWWVTKGLRDFAAEQALDMKSSINVARSSAEAAQMAAHAAVAADLPILVVESVTYGPRATHATVHIGNHGRTPAIISTDCLVLTLAPALDDKPRYPIDTLERPDRPRIVEPKHEYCVQRTSAVSEDQWKRVLAREEILWIHGYVEYTDYLKVKRIDGFCFAFEPRQTAMYPSMPPGDGAWVDVGPATYTFTRPA